MLILWTILQCLFLAPHVVASVMLKGDGYGLVRLRAVPCNKKNVWEVFVIAMPVNIVAALVIAASNNARQILLAPSRRDLDREKWHSWDIGIPSLRSLGKVPWSKKSTWILLGITSLPLHLLYNSLFMIMPSTYDAYQVIVSETPLKAGIPVRLEPLTPSNILKTNNITFDKGPTYNSYFDAFPALDDLETAISDMQSAGVDPRKWQNLSQQDCAKTYGSKFYQQYSTVILVTNWTDTNADNNSAIFLGALAGASYGYQALIDYCPPDFLAANQNNYSTPKSYSHSKKLGQLCQSYTKNDGISEPAKISGMVIEYCIAQKEQETCTIVTSLLLWRIIAALLTVQVLGMLTTIITTPPTPLLVVGDAISSFLKRPDAVHFEKGDPEEGTVGQSIVILSIPIYLWFIVALVLGTQSNLRPGLTVPEASDHTWFLKLVLWTNAIQILTVIRQYFENCYLSRGQAIHELQSFRSKRRGLRVTQPVNGTQHSSYLLSLPAGKAIGHIGATAFLHWWLGIFLSVTAVFVYRVGDNSAHVQAVNRSAAALGNFIPASLELYEAGGRAANGGGAENFVLVILLPFLVLSIPILMHGCMIGKMYKSNAPKADGQLNAIDSRTISRACHPPEEEGDISGRQLMYGLVNDVRTFTSQAVGVDEEHELCIHQAELKTKRSTWKGKVLGGPSADRDSAGRDIESQRQRSRTSDDFGDSGIQAGGASELRYT